MKTFTSIPAVIILFLISFLVGAAVFPYQAAQAQESNYLEPSQNYSKEELAQMLAPIALYPDALLSQVLMASTYPIEVIEADRWVKRNPELKDEALDDALLPQDWDPSVKALCHFPAILALMSEKISETTNIGNAFLAQEEEVMAMVQELRAKAYAQGNLTTNSEQKILVEKETIIIQPAAPGVIYVPYYDPYSIYGPWWYPNHPPYYWGPSRVSIGVGISYWPGFYFGFAFGSWSYFDWHRHNIYIDVHKRPRYVRHDRWWTDPGRWRHAPRHRRGVAYRDKPTARKYGQYPGGTRRFRADTRGFPESRQPGSVRGERLDNRSRIERYNHGNDRPAIERSQLRTVPGTRTRQRIEPDKRKQLPVQPSTGTRQRIEPDRMKQKRVEPTIQKRQRVETQTREQQRVGPQTRVLQQNEPRTQERQRIDRRQQLNRGNVFNRVEEGRIERQSSERGRYSRQRMNNDFRSQSRSGGENRNNRENRGRNR